MTATDSERGSVARPWTCPFCPLLCDGFSARVEPAGLRASAPGDTPLALIGSDCPRARSALARFDASAAAAQPLVDGKTCSIEQAVAVAAQLLVASRQPLFAGLGTDVAGARALYALACATGAISDAAGGPALTAGLRALQDRGGFTTTLAEVRSRADLIVCIGGLPTDHYPEFFRRCGVTTDLNSGRAAAVVVLGATTPVEGNADALADANTARSAVEGPRAEYLSAPGDLFDAVAMLAALLDRRVASPTAPAELVALAARLNAARYAVIVYDLARLPAPASLLIEAIDRSVAVLNRSTRAAASPLGGADGGSTVNQVYTWLSGLPLRSRAGPAGLEHEPLQFDASRLLTNSDVDALLWVASFGTETPPPESPVPRVVLGHPRWALDLDQGRDSVFIPVSTPGIGSSGHLFRTDGAVLMPLAPVYSDRLPTVAAVVGRITGALRALQTLPAPASQSAARAEATA